LNYDEILEARRIYGAGRNVSQHFRGGRGNPLEAVELVYDLQAGSYIQYAEQHRASLLEYAKEMAAIARRHVSAPACWLDVGCGELTTLSFFLSEVPDLVEEAHAFDVSLSRLLVGRRFAESNLRLPHDRLNLVAAELQALPYRTRSVDVCVSNHALEPNGGQEANILQEIFRVTRDVVLLFEPCYESASIAAKRRMESLGYIRDLENTARRLGGRVLDVVPMKEIRNPDNPTACFILQPPANSAGCSRGAAAGAGLYSLPGTDLPLHKHSEGYLSPDTGILLPTIMGVPILRKKSSLFATALL
jgi:SAM-dependent methyltransferase